MATKQQQKPSQVILKWGLRPINYTNIKLHHQKKIQKFQTKADNNIDINRDPEGQNKWRRQYISNNNEQIEANNEEEDNYLQQCQGKFEGAFHKAYYPQKRSPA